MMSFQMKEFVDKAGVEYVKNILLNLYIDATKNIFSGDIAVVHRISQYNDKFHSFGFTVNETTTSAISYDIKENKNIVFIGGDFDMKSLLECEYRKWKLNNIFENDN